MKLPSSLSLPLLLAFLPMLLAVSCKPKTSSPSGATTEKKDLPPAVEETALNPRAGGISIDPEKGELKGEEYLSITFPSDMAGKELIGKSVPAPVVISPDLNHSFMWTSPRRGLVKLEHLGASPVARRVTLREGLMDLGGKPVPAQGWGAEFASEDFGLRSVYYLEEGGDPWSPRAEGKLNSNQHVELTFSRNVTPAEVAEQVAFLDSGTEEKFRVRVATDQQQPAVSQGVVIVEPDQPLPPDRQLWLVIERMKDSREARPLPHLRIYPAGRTSPMAATWARGHNQPRNGKFIRVGFSKNVDPRTATAGAFKIEPPVAVREIKIDDKEVELYGDFATDTDYRVTVATDLASKDASAVREPTTLEIHIPEMRPSIGLDAGRIAQRSSTGMSVKVSNCRTGPLQWKLATVSGDRYPEVEKRLKEFAEFQRDDEMNPVLDPRNGEVRFTETEFLVPVLKLPVVASGELKESRGEEELAQSIKWAAGLAKPGTYLLEISGKDLEGRTCGNRCLVTLSDWWVRNVRVGTQDILQISSMDTMAPVAQVPVRCFGWDGKETNVVSTSADGSVVLPGSAQHLFVKIGGGEILHSLSGITRAPEPHDDSKDPQRALLITDGDIYQAGEKVRFFFTARDEGPDGTLMPPKDRELDLTISTELPGFQGHTLKFPLDDTGSTSGEWRVPATALSGTYTLMASSGGKHSVQHVTICDFRLPDFHIDLSAPMTTGSQAKVAVRSTYFHGAPNADAEVQWTAEWVQQDWNTWEGEDDPPWAYHQFNDSFSPDAAKQGTEGILTALLSKAGDGLPSSLAVPASAAVRGKGVLNADGVLEITTECPFPEEARARRAQVFWTVDVKGKAGETQRRAAVQRLQFAEQILAIRADWSDAGSMEADVVALTPADTAGKGFAFDLELFHREVKVAKERVGEHLVRYRNAPLFRSVWKARKDRPGSFKLPMAEPGDYVVVATPVGMPGAVAVSDEIHGFDGAGEGPVVDDFSVEVVSDKPSYQVGDKARITIRSPFAGWAAVSAETDRVLYTLPPVKLEGEASSVTIPITGDCFPNFHVRVTVGTGGEGGKGPAERSGECELTVTDTRKLLEVKTELGKEMPYLPGEEVTGRVRVLAAGQPLANTRVMIMAIDNALLSLGDWKAPDVIATFYPQRTHHVFAARALGEDWYPVQRKRLGQSQKGFIVGDGAGYGGGASARTQENEEPKPLWQTSLVTGADGSVPFKFTASGALTSYRIFSLAHTPRGEIGTAVKQVVISKDLKITPFLPSFVREGDTVEVRCLIANDGKKPLSFTPRITASGAARLEEGEQSNWSLPAAGTRVLTRTARIAPGSAGKDAEFILSADAGGGTSDTVRVRVPVLPAHILQTEVHSGEIAAGSAWDPSVAFGRFPSDATFPCDVFLSGTNWLPKLANLPSESRRVSPALADVAIASLCAVMRPEITSYLPGLPQTEPETYFGRDFQRTMDELASSAIQDARRGWLPRWPEGSEPDDITTALVAFCIDLAASRYDGSPSSLPIPQSLRTALNRWRWATLEDQSDAERSKEWHFVRCMAMVLEARDRDSTMVSGNRCRAVVVSSYSHREQLDLESKCMLALANHLFANQAEPLECLTGEQTRTLISEIQHDDAPLDYRPETLGTRVRAEAIRLHTLSELGRVPAGSAREELRRLMKPIRDSSADLSSQESLWVLLAAMSAIELDQPTALGKALPPSTHQLVSPNGVSLGWLGHPLADQRKRFARPLSMPAAATWMIRATHRKPIESPERDESLGLSRSINNLTEAARTGSEKAPFKLGDYVLVTYVVESGQALHQLEIEESLPAALEVINPDLPSVRAAFKFPDEGEGNQAELAYANRRNHSVELYFDILPPGTNRYSVLTRVAGAGSFAWPASQAAPVYDKRFKATTVDGTVWSSGAP